MNDDDGGDAGGDFFFLLFRCDYFWPGDLPPGNLGLVTAICVVDGNPGKWNWLVGANDPP